MTREQLIAKRDRAKSHRKSSAHLQKQLVEQVCKALNYGRKRRKKIRFCGVL